MRRPRTDGTATDSGDETRGETGDSRPRTEEARRWWHRLGLPKRGFGPDPGLTLEPQETSDETRLAAASAGQPFLFFLPLSWSEDVEGRHEAEAEAEARGTRHG